MLGSRGLILAIGTSSSLPKSMYEMLAVFWSAGTDWTRPRYHFYMQWDGVAITSCENRGVLTSL